MSGSYPVFWMAGLTTSEPICDMPTEWPSGSEFDRICIEITPLAPGRLSTMTCVPRLAESLGCRMRATRSVAPPGGKPTMKRTGLLGPHSAAKAGAARSDVDAAMAAAMRLIGFMGKALG